MDILIIEADIDLASNLCDILALDGHRAVAAGRVHEADAPIDWSRLGVVFIDTFLCGHMVDALPPDLCEDVPHVSVRFVTGDDDILAAVEGLRMDLAGRPDGRLEWDTVLTDYSQPCGGVLEGLAPWL